MGAPASYIFRASALKGVASTPAEASAGEASAPAEASAASEAGAAGTGLRRGREGLIGRGGKGVHGAGEHQRRPHHAGSSVAGADIPGGRIFDESLECLGPVVLDAEGQGVGRSEE